MARKITIRFCVTDDAKEALREFMRSSGFEDPVPGILWGELKEQERTDFVFGLYERETLVSEFPGYFIEGSGVEFVVPQDFLVENLHGKTLDYINGRYVIRQTDH